MKKQNETKEQFVRELEKTRKRVSELERAEEALRESEEKLRVIFESITDGIIVSDLEGQIIDENEAAVRLQGYSDRVEVIGRTGFEFIAEKDRARAIENAMKAVEQGYGPAHEYMFVDKDGREYDAEASASLLLDSAGNTTGFISVFRDITERRRAEEELRESEERYRTVLETIEEGYYEVDLAGNLTFFNDSLCGINGYPRDEMMGMNNRQYMSDETAKVVYETFNRVYRTGEPARAFGWQVIRKDGTKSFVEASISLMSGPSGDPVGFRGFIRDIAERERAEQALKASEEKLRAMFESITDGIVVTDLQGIILDVNDVVVRMSGLSREEIIGKDGFSLIPSEDRDKVVDQGKKIVRGETGPVRMEHEISPKVGSSSTTNLILGTMHDSEGNPTGFVAIAQDFTERKKAENALRESEAKYRDLVESISDVIYSVDANGVTTYISPVVESVLGYTPSELIGSSFADFIYQEDLQSATEGFMNTLSGNSETGEFRVVTKSGEVRWVRSSNHPVFEEDRVIGVTGVITDITERKRAEEALRESEEKMRITFESIGDAVAVIDLEGRFVQVNEAAARMSGYTKEELVGRNVLETIIAKKDRDKIVLDMAQTLGEGDALGVRSYTLVNRDGREFESEFSTAVLRDSSRNIINFVGVARDVTERKRAEEERESLLHELERSNAELQQFAHVASHDLQEPLRMVASYTQLLEKRYKGSLDADADDFIAYAVDGARRMQNLIQGLLSYSRVGSRGKPFEPTECESVFEQALANLKLTIDESGAGVTHDPLPRVIADETQLIQLFQNLLANAIKFCGEEQPRIHVSAKQDSNECLFSVSDNGIGINPEYFDRIFVIFQRLHGREEYPGTGIGLSVCKRIVERHGGRIWVESQPGEGSTFHFAIPKGGEEQ